MMHKLVFLGLAIVIVAVASAQKTYTAQSQMIQVNISGGGTSNTFIIQGNTKWSFNDTCAGTKRV